MSISAKNYAAQAQAAARVVSLKRPESRSAVDFYRLASIAQHFAIPDGGKVFNDGLKGLGDLHGLDVHLPFDVITVEFMADRNKYCTLACKDKSSSPIFFFAAGDQSKWVILPICVSLESLSSGELEVKVIRDQEFSLKESVWNGYERAAEFLTVSVLELCEALSCSNVDSEVIETIDQRKNERRIRQGKLPLYETRRLVIKAPLTRSAGNSAGGVSDRQGPREHLRRGHIRRMQDGRRIWVQSCVVGNRENGAIKKSYGVIAS